ncbi:MAG TPA: MATE family efflux transporter [Clostridiaceae bacterium]|nr:MATE family efflux transporter [Clostridiaceae bacterium]
MRKELKKDYLFTNKDLMQLILPLMVDQLLAITVGLADSIMVSSIGESAVSAVSLVDSITILLINIFAAIASGGAIVVGQYIGQKRPDMARKAGEQLLVFVMFVSVVIMAILYLGKGFILNVVFGKIEPDVKDFANTYLLIVFASIPFIAMYNSGAALFRAIRNSRITLATSIIMNVINISGNALLIYGFGMKVEGAAIPTLISRAVAAIIIVVLLMDESLTVYISKNFRYKFDKKMVLRILNLGIPNGIENSMFQLGKILLLSIISGLGTVSIAANAVANTISAFQIITGIAVGLGLITVVSQCVGAGDYEQVRYYTRKLLIYTYISFVIVNAVIILAMPLILKIYNLSSETAGMAKQLIVFNGIASSLFWPTAFTLPNTLRSSNDVQYTMVVGISSMWIFRIGFGVLFVKYFNMGVFGVWIAMYFDWIVRAALFIIRYRGHKWQIYKENGS